jgi:hypothetical protein
VKNNINIEKYAAYFHDGIIADIICFKNEIRMNICSAEIDPEEVEKNIILSKDNSISGVLHFHNVINVEISNGLLLENLFKIFDHGTILDFEIKDGNVELGILWTNYLPKPRTNEFSRILIKADKIWWENIPDLKMDRH